MDRHTCGVAPTIHSPPVQRRDDRRLSKRLHVPEALAITILVTGAAGCGKELPVPDARQPVPDARQPVADARRPDADAAVADAMPDARPDAGVDAAVADAGVDAAVADAMPDTPLG
jgi:hypothetical protein